MTLFMRDAAGNSNGYTTIFDVGAALGRGELPLRSDGSFYEMSDFMGGVLLDGYPLNVLLYNAWYPDQLEALQAAGYTIPASALSLPVRDPIPEGGGDMSTYLKYAVIAAAVYFLVIKK